MKASDLFVKALENEGVEYVFGVPGEENLDFVESLRDSSIRLILTRHEQGAGFMAATYGRLTGRPGVCLSTLGPGATNLVTPAAYALLGAMPMLMITGQKPIKHSKQGRFQIVDVVAMMRPLTQYTRQFVDGNNIPPGVREAFRIMREERPGPAHLELPEDIASENTEAQLIEPEFARRAEASQKAIECAVEMIENAMRPLILIGAAANRNRTSSALEQLIAKTGIPFFNTQMGKGVLDENHRLYIGTAALSDHDYIHCAIDRADLIINIGHDVIEKPPFFMRHGDGRKVIHINNFSASVDSVYFPQAEVVGDIADAVERMCERISVQSDWTFEYYMRIKHQLDEHIGMLAADDSFPVKPQRLVADLRAVMPDDGIVTLDNGMYKIWFARNYRATQPNTLLLDNALATMGAGLPSAMAAKIVHPERKVVAVCGDGGFMMNSQEIETAVRLGLDLVVVILTDSAYGMIKWKQEGMGFDDFGLDFRNPDFVKYAEAYGAKGHRLNSTAELRDCLTRLLDTPGVHLLDVPIDYSDNHRLLNEELQAKTCLL